MPELKMIPIIYNPRSHLSTFQPYHWGSLFPREMGSDLIRRIAELRMSRSLVEAIEKKSSVDEVGCILNNRLKELGMAKSFPFRGNFALSQLMNEDVSVIRVPEGSTFIVHYDPEEDCEILFLNATTIVDKDGLRIEHQVAKVVK